MLKVNLQLLRQAIRDHWERLKFNQNGRSDVDVAVVQYSLGMALEADGLLGPRTYQRLLTLLTTQPPWTASRRRAVNSEPVHAPGFVTVRLAEMHGKLRALIGPDRDVDIALLQLIVGVEPTGFLDTESRAALLLFLEEKWVGPGGTPRGTWLD